MVLIFDSTRLIRDPWFGHESSQRFEVDQKKNKKQKQSQKQIKLKKKLKNSLTKWIKHQRNKEHEE
jgi:hypothetical protein